MTKDWILQTNERRKRFSQSTWIPLRALVKKEQGECDQIGFYCDYFGCAGVAFYPEYKHIAEKTGWSDIGIGCMTHPHAYEDGSYSTIDQYQWNDKGTVGVHLVFEYEQPVIGGKIWMINPDLVVALGLVKEGNSWVRSEENFIEVIKEYWEGDQPVKIEIRREFLIDYLAARNLLLKLSYYYERVENVKTLESSEYCGISECDDDKDDGHFEVRVRPLKDIFDKKISVCRCWRKDFNGEDEAPVIGPETEENTAVEYFDVNFPETEGFNVMGAFWRDEWILHDNISKRVRGDDSPDSLLFIVETDGQRKSSQEILTQGDVRWLWFKPGIINQLLSFRGFSLEWRGSEIGVIRCATGHYIDFGLNSADLITVFASDIAELPEWQQHYWVAHNVVPEGGVSKELWKIQMMVEAVSTCSVETLLYEGLVELEKKFKEKLKIKLFLNDIKREDFFKKISRFNSVDQDSLLRLSKEFVRFFSDRLNVKELQVLSNSENKEKLGSNKLLQNILSQKVGDEKARNVFEAIVGAYDMRVGDAHPTSSNIKKAFKLVGINEEESYLRQGEQLIEQLAKSIQKLSQMLFDEQGK